MQIPNPDTHSTMGVRIGVRMSVYLDILMDVLKIVIIKYLCGAYITYLKLHF